MSTRLSSRPREGSKSATSSTQPGIKVYDFTDSIEKDARRRGLKKKDWSKKFDELITTNGGQISQKVMNELTDWVESHPYQNKGKQKARQPTTTNDTAPEAQKNVSTKEEANQGRNTASTLPLSIVPTTRSNRQDRGTASTSPLSSVPATRSNSHVTASASQTGSVPATRSNSHVTASASQTGSVPATRSNSQGRDTASTEPLKGNTPKSIISISSDKSSSLSTRSRSQTRSTPGTVPSTRSNSRGHSSQPSGSASTKPGVVNSAIGVELSRALDAVKQWEEHDFDGDIDMPDRPLPPESSFNLENMIDRLSSLAEIMGESDNKDVIDILRKARRKMRVIRAAESELRESRSGKGAIRTKSTRNPISSNQILHKSNLSHTGVKNRKAKEPGREKTARVRLLSPPRSPRMPRITTTRPVPIKATSKAPYEFDFDVDPDKMSIDTVDEGESSTNNRNRIEAPDTDDERMTDEQYSADGNEVDDQENANRNKDDERYNNGRKSFEHEYSPDGYENNEDIFEDDENIDHDIVDAADGDFNTEDMLNRFPLKMKEHIVTTQTPFRLRYRDPVQGKRVVHADIHWVTARGQLFVSFPGRNKNYPNVKAGAIIPVPKCRKAKKDFIASGGKIAILRDIASFEDCDLEDFELYVIASAPQKKSSTRYPETQLLGRFRHEDFSSIFSRSAFVSVFGADEAEELFARQRIMDGTPHPQKALDEGWVVLGEDLSPTPDAV
ncbi:hypothetical protein F5B17DRAFT_382261 [Nemania serpens]|nr:hypothetical protein F5B17DRAFT_382261 [Nemania serpens]